MLSKIELENFKRFQGRTIFPLGRLTLLTGVNGCGMTNKRRHNLKTQREFQLFFRFILQCVTLMNTVGAVRYAFTPVV